MFLNHPSKIFCNSTELSFLTSNFYLGCNLEILNFVICNAKHTSLVMPTAIMIPLQYRAQLIRRSELGNCEVSKPNSLNIRETASIICISN